jgi:integrase
MELLWFTGCRLGALRGLDLRDFDADEQWLAFKYRPPHTPLKNKNDGERTVALTEATTNVVRTYINQYRYQKRDKDGRRPLVTSTHGRPSTDSIRNWTYQATLPCLHSPCPHGKSRPVCEWTQYDQASKCPSSRSPHQIRTGAITRMLNKWPKERVAHRVNTYEFPHYDMATEQEKMEEREREHIGDIALDEDDSAARGDDEQNDDRQKGRS